LNAVKAPAVAGASTRPSTKPEPIRRSDTSTQPPKAAPRPATSKAPIKAAPAKTMAAPQSDGGGWLRTALFSLMAAGVSYYGITLLFGAPAPKPTLAEPSAVTPVPTPVVETALAAPAPKLQLTATDSALPPGMDVPAGLGLLEIQVPDATAIRVDGEYLGMGPGRRVPLSPGTHQVTLGDSAPQSVTIKVGQRTLATAASASSPAPAGSP
jgi:hypothetical protein